MKALGGSARVLLVDDEELVLDALAPLLERGGFDVRRARSARDALAVLGREPIDVIVSDHEMPGTNGCELLARVAHERPEIARVLLTGKATLEVAVRAVNEAGVFRILQKPARFAEIAGAIAEARRSRSARRVVPGAAAIDDASLSRLSRREREILDLVTDGLRVSQIAATLFVSQHTVRNHLKAVFRKLGVRSQRELLARARAA